MAEALVIVMMNRISLCKRRLIDGSGRGSGGGRASADPSPTPRFGDALFRRRFRMHRPLFMHIVGALERRYEFFRIGEDAGRQTRTHANTEVYGRNQQPAYGGPADMFDEYLHIGESSAVECPLEFCAGVRAIFGDRYLRRPSSRRGRPINMHGSVHGFHGMLGGIDCMHWEWRNRPAALEGDTHFRLQSQASHDDP
ncbi:uncharacterized protein LOC125206279 [Salvia hispanica]|uniref:uncharacterized protein LOC125206279 n=1 Tax=Salvia hispanica TaxID=49212 RepID=UPI00200929B0|nr:uncharacterized protein LOC125206279 [Salvia hispanica]